jgi:hypothetical protein
MRLISPCIWKRVYKHKHAVDAELIESSVEKTSHTELWKTSDKYTTVESRMRTYWAKKSNEPTGQRCQPNIFFERKRQELCPFIKEMPAQHENEIRLLVVLVHTQIIRGPV